MKERSLAIGSTLAALLASLCCLGPLVLGGAGLGLVATFAPLRPYFLAVSGVLLAGGFYLVYRKPKTAEACAGETCAPESRTRRMAKPLLWVAALAVAALAFFPSLRRQISWQTCRRSINLFSNAPNRRVKDQGYGLSGLLWRDSAKAA